MARSAPSRGPIQNNDIAAETHETLFAHIESSKRVELMPSKGHDSAILVPNGGAVADGVSTADHSKHLGSEIACIRFAEFAEQEPSHITTHEELQAHMARVREMLHAVSVEIGRSTTTFTASLFWYDSEDRIHATIVNVGDSLPYLVHGDDQGEKKVTRLAFGESVAGMLLREYENAEGERKEEYLSHYLAMGRNRRNEIGNSLGTSRKKVGKRYEYVPNEAKIGIPSEGGNIYPVPLYEYLVDGDDVSLLLMSDGLIDVLDPMDSKPYEDVDNILQVLQQDPDNDPTEVLMDYILQNDNKGDDKSMVSFRIPSQRPGGTDPAEGREASDTMHVDVSGELAGRIQMELSFDDISQIEHNAGLIALRIGRALKGVGSWSDDKRDRLLAGLINGVLEQQGVIEQKVPQIHSSPEEIEHELSVFIDGIAGKLLEQFGENDTDLLLSIATGKESFVEQLMEDLRTLEPIKNLARTQAFLLLDKRQRDSVDKSMDVWTQESVTASTNARYMSELLEMYYTVRLETFLNLS